MDPWFTVGAGVLGLIGGFLTSVFAEPLRRWIYRPRLEVSFGDSREFLTKTPEGVEDSRHEALYVRVRVVNTSAALAKGCRAYLVNIERKGRSGNFEPTEYCESLQLAWSAQATRKFDAFELPRHAPHFVDVMSTRSTATAFRLETLERPFRYEQMLATPGVYRFTVVVSGDAVKPVTIRPAVDWKGVWDQIARVDLK